MSKTRKILDTASFLDTQAKILDTKAKILDTAPTCFFFCSFGNLNLDTFRHDLFYFKYFEVKHQQGFTFDSDSLLAFFFKRFVFQGFDLDSIRFDCNLICLHSHSSRAIRFHVYAIPFQVTLCQIFAGPCWIMLNPSKAKLNHVGKSKGHAESCWIHFKLWCKSSGPSWIMLNPSRAKIDVCRTN